MTDRGEPIPESRIIRDGTTCGFCGGPKHYGFCDALREYNSRAMAERKPLVNPLVRPA